MENLDFSGFKELRGIDETTQKDSKQINPEIENFYCKTCNEYTISIDEGINVCTACGIEGDIYLSTKEEWSMSINNEGKDITRCGMVSHPLLPNLSLGTIAQGKHSTISILQLQSTSHSNERSIFEAIKQIKKASATLHINGVLADKACYLYCKVTSKLVIKRGKVRKALMANCQFVICKNQDDSSYVPPEILSKAYGITVKKFNEGSKLFNELSYYKTNNDIKWTDNLRMSNEEFTKPTHPENIVKNVCGKLNISSNNTAIIIYIAKKVLEFRIASNKMPQSISAGCIWLFLKNNKDKTVKIDDVANYCTVSITTTKTTHVELKKYKKYIIPDMTNILLNKHVLSLTPVIELDKIYIAPKTAIPPFVPLFKDKETIKVNRGRPKLNKKK